MKERESEKNKQSYALSQYAIRHPKGERKKMVIMTVNKPFRRPIFLIIYFLCTYNVEIEISVRDTNVNGHDCESRKGVV